MAAISQIYTRHVDSHCYSQKSTVKQEDPVWIFF